MQSMDTIQPIVAILVVNFRRAMDTLECLDSLLQVSNPPFHIFLADNGSSDEDIALLRDYTDQYRERITLTLFRENYGFTGAHNRLLEHIFSHDRRYEFILLLNNDTVVEPNFLARMLEQIDRAQHIEMVAARMIKYSDRTSIDNLGITFYKCGLASNRKSLDDPLLGPCGGCALYTTELLGHIHRETSEYFDDNFFCYAEDTDLAWRAILLGYRAAYADDALVYHKGSVSSGGPNSDFVLYYGIRNSLFVLIKNIPSSLLLQNIGWIILLHGAILLRHAAKGKLIIVLRIYFDFLSEILIMLKKRPRIIGNRKITLTQIGLHISKKFYEHNYLKLSLTELLNLAKNHPKTC